MKLGMRFKYQAQRIRILSKQVNEVPNRRSKLLFVIYNDIRMRGARRNHRSTQMQQPRERKMGTNGRKLPEGHSSAFAEDTTKAR